MARITRGPQKLVSGYFYNLAVETRWVYEGSKEYTEIEGTGEPSITSFPDEYQYSLSVECARAKDVKLSACPRDKSHVTDQYAVDIELDAQGDEPPSPLLPAQAGGGEIVTNALRKQMEQSGMKGFRFERVKSVQHYGKGTIDEKSDTEHPLVFYNLVPTAPCLALSMQWVEPASENRCPFCERGPIVCEACGHRERNCPKCGEKVCVHEEDAVPGERRLIIPSAWRKSVVNVNYWNGADYFSYGRVTRRFVDFLLSVHAYPFVAVPISANIHGITAEKKDLLESALRLPSKA